MSAVLSEFVRVVVQNEERLIRDEIAAAFRENRPLRNVWLPRRAWFELYPKLVHLAAVDVEHIYL